MPIPKPSFRSNKQSVIFSVFILITCSIYLFLIVLVPDPGDVCEQVPDETEPRGHRLGHPGQDTLEIFMYLLESLNSAHILRGPLVRKEGVAIIVG